MSNKVLTYALGMISLLIFILDLYIGYELTKLFPLNPIHTIWLPALPQLFLWGIITILGLLNIAQVKFLILITSPWIIYLIIKMIPQILGASILFKITGIMGILCILILILTTFLFFFQYSQKRRI